MRIGIGVTTYNRRECLKECLENIFKHTMSEFYLLTDYDKCVNSLTNQHDFDLGKNLEQIKIYVAKDTDQDRKGVAYRKNECLRALKDCDYVFLFDDDCFPIKDGWIEFCINEGSEHLLFLSDQLHGKINDRAYKNCGGVFMFMTKGVIERVGAFNEKFGMYGFEHAEYSNRITGQRTHYPTNVNLNDYLFAHDYSTPRHKSSITDEEKLKCIKNNWDLFFKSEIKDIYLPL